MTTYRSDWLLPIADAPVRDGWVSIDSNRITALGHGAGPGAINLGRAVVLPALVNVHTHLELSYLHGRVPPDTQFTQWARTLMALRRQYPDPSAPEILSAARRAVAAAREAGTGLIGDVSNTLVTVPLLREASMPGQVFHELLGFNVADPVERVHAATTAHHAVGADDRDVRVSLAAHAPYSVSPALFQAIRAAIDAKPAPITSVHLGESADEVEF